MTDAKKISDKFSAGGQPTPEDLKQLADRGFKSVVNLRSLDEAGALVDEQQQAEAAGLQYVNMPLQSTEANAELRAKFHKSSNCRPPCIFIGVSVDEPVTSS